MADCNVSTLLEQACTSGFKCMGETEFRMLLLQVLCNLSESGGGVGEVLTGAFDDPNGNVTPSNTAAAAIYYKDHASQVNQWRWSVADQVWYQNMGP